MNPANQITDKHAVNKSGVKQNLKERNLSACKQLRNLLTHGRTELAKVIVGQS